MRNRIKKNQHKKLLICAYYIGAYYIGDVRKGMRFIKFDNMIII